MAHRSPSTHSLASLLAVTTTTAQQVTSIPAEGNIITTSRHSFSSLERNNNTSMTATEPSSQQHASTNSITLSHIDMSTTTIQQRETQPTTRRPATDNDIGIDLFHDNNNTPGCDFDEDEEPFQIRRKLLRRRHVLKEQRQKVRERAAAARLAEKQKEAESRKRTRLDQQKKQSVEASQNSNTHPSPLHLSPRKPTPGMDVSHPESTREYNQFHICRRGIKMGYSPLYSPTGVAIPSFSPLRPSKRRNTRSA